MEEDLLTYHLISNKMHLKEAMCWQLNAQNALNMALIY